MDMIERGMVLKKLYESCEDCSLGDDERCEKCHECAVRIAMDAVEQAPAMDDAVPVVRCKDCINRDTEIMYCGMVDLIINNDDWFCAWGERKDDGDNH